MNRFLPAIVACLPFSTFVIPAIAQDGPFSDVSLGVGGFVTIAPAYEGSDEYRVFGVPYAFPVFGGDWSERSRVAFRGVDDVRLSVFRRGGFDIGPIVGYSFGRKEDVSAKLTGLGDVDGGLVLGGFASYTAGGFFADLGASTQVTGGSDTGFVATAGVGYTAEIAPRFSLTGRTDVEYASGAYMDRYFTVTPAQSAASTENYAVFDADAGVKNVAASVTLSFEATERLTLRANGGYSRLLNDAAASPIGVSDNQLSGGLGASFRF